MFPFNIRVYGLLINEKQEILISDEERFGQCFSKFPGGGLEYGEGLIEGLKREFLEECNLEVEITDHFYTTDFFVKSAFDDSQVISIYYQVKSISSVEITIPSNHFVKADGQIREAFRWVSLARLTIQEVTFPIDQYVVKIIKEKYEQEPG